MRNTLAVVAAGLVLIACSDDSSSNDCTVSAVAISGAPASVNVGGSATLTTNITQENCTDLTVTWSTSNSGVLAVNQSGQVTGQAAGGPVTITATAGGKSGTAQISVVNAAVNSVSIAPDSIIIGTGATFSLVPTTFAADNSVLTGRTVTWGTSAAGVATVNNGLVTAVAAGSANITATSETKNGVGKVFVARPRAVYFWAGNRVPVGTEAPSAEYAYSTNAASVMGVQKTATGTYTVSYTGFARTSPETEALFVTAFLDNRGEYCTLGSWLSQSGIVRCWGPTGTAIDLPFNFLAVGSATFGGRSGYAWSDQSAATSPFSPDPGWRYSSSNLPITITRTGTGVYTVLFAGQGRTSASDREGMMVSGYGTGNSDCHGSGWTTVGAGLSTTVYCYNATGAPVDAQFTIGLVSEPRTGAKLGFADADQPSSTTAYTPVNSKVLPTGTATVTRSAVGQYSVRFEGLSRAGTTKESFQVSALGTTTNRCAVYSWSYDATGATVAVYCGTVAGVAADTRFSIVAVN